MKLAFTLAAVLVSAVAVTATAVPASAETTVIKKVRHGEFGRTHKKVVIKRHGSGETTVKKVIRHDD